MLKPDEHERNESELRSLFQTMRAADAQRAPSFVQVTRSQTYRAMPYRDRLGYRRAMVMAAVAVVILVVVSVNALRQGAKSAGESPASTRVSRGEAQAMATTKSKAAAEGGRATLAGGSPASTRPKPARGHKATTPASVPSISAWKSPTEALLKTPGDDLRTTLPKIGFTPGKSSTSE